MYNMTTWDCTGMFNLVFGAFLGLAGAVVRDPSHIHQNTVKMRYYGTCAVAFFLSNQPPSPPKKILVRKTDVFFSLFLSIKIPF